MIRHVTCKTGLCEEEFVLLSMFGGYNLYINFFFFNVDSPSSIPKSVTGHQLSMKMTFYRWAGTHRTRDKCPVLPSKELPVYEAQ